MKNANGIRHYYVTGGGDATVRWKAGDTIIPNADQRKASKKPFDLVWYQSQREVALENMVAK